MCNEGSDLKFEASSELDGQCCFVGGRSGESDDKANRFLFWAEYWSSSSELSDVEISQTAEAETERVGVICVRQQLSTVEPAWVSGL